ncbi:hypothetical protein GIHI108528_08130 [Gillisia hiemivivida]
MLLKLRKCICKEKGLLIERSTKITDYSPFLKTKVINILNKKNATLRLRLNIYQAIFYATACSNFGTLLITFLIEFL